MEQFDIIRKAHFLNEKSIREIAREQGVHRRVVRQAIAAARIRALACGDCLERAEPVLFFGEPGTGKTHLATALGVAAAKQGRAVRFVTAARLVTV